MGSGGVYRERFLFLFGFIKSILIGNLINKKTVDTDGKINIHENVVGPKITFVFPL